MILTVVSILQIIFASVTVLFLKYGNLAVVDDLEWAKLKPYGLYIFAFVILASCSTVKEKASGLKEIGKITKECPPKEERTLKHIFCKENK